MAGVSKVLLMGAPGVTHLEKGYWTFLYETISNLVMCG